MWKTGIDYQEMAAQEQGNPYAQFMAGETLLRAGDFVRAMPFFRKASEMAPHHPESLRGHAICLIMTGQYEQGLALCASLLARLPVDFTTLLISAEAFIGLSQYKEAAEAYRQAALLDYEAVTAYAAQVGYVGGRRSGKCAMLCQMRGRTVSEFAAEIRAISP